MAVVGLGAIGLMAVECAFLMGATSAFAVEPVPERRAIAAALGAVLHPDEAPQAIREATGGRMAESVVEAVGAEGYDRAGDPAGQASARERFGDRRQHEPADGISDGAAVRQRPDAAQRHVFGGGAIADADPAGAARAAAPGTLRHLRVRAGGRGGSLCRVRRARRAR
ncbi:zinc-binding dehydrogenase [Sphingomonas sp. MMS24-JH45]